ncbi:hypothetical protein OBV_p-00210 (plasmid) [Oscillibacter valericigenes Sjm18-20]|nr:hypothetical protein OBV_p-00210 [Oscillibacter valericigenes Sjm18-20]
MRKKFLGEKKKIMNKEKAGYTVQELISELEKIEDKNREVYIRGSDFFFNPVNAVCDISDNLIGLSSGNVEVPIEEALESLYSHGILAKE